MFPGAAAILLCEFAVDIEESSSEKLHTVSISLDEEIIAIIRSGINTKVYLKLPTIEFIYLFHYKITSVLNLRAVFS